MIETRLEDVGIGEEPTPCNQSELIRRYVPTQEEVDNVRLLLTGMNASNWIRKRNEALDILLGT